MSYLEKISGRTVGAENADLTKTEQALPSRDLFWPEAAKGRDPGLPHAEENRTQEESAGSDDKKRNDPVPVEPGHSEFSYAKQDSPRQEIKPSKPGSLFTAKDKGFEIQPAEKQHDREEPEILVPRERPPFLEKIIERTVYKNQNSLPLEIIERKPEFYGLEPMTEIEKPSFFAARELTENNKSTIILPVATHRAAIAERVVSEKKQTKPFIEPGASPQPLQKKETEARLIIGRITVEVSHPVAAPVPSASPRQNSGSRSPVNNTYSIDKLSFGLGQL